MCYGCFLGGGYPIAAMGGRTPTESDAALMRTAGTEMAAAKTSIWLASHGDEWSPINHYTDFYQQIQSSTSNCRVHAFRTRTHDQLFDVLWSRKERRGASKRRPRSGVSLSPAEAHLRRDVEEWLCRGGPPPQAQTYAV